MKTLPIEKSTRLETAVLSGSSVAEILDFKMKEAEEKGLPIEAHLADYIALGVGSFDEKIKEYQNYKKQIDEAIEIFKSDKLSTASDVAEYLASNGIDKLKGLICSSVTLKKSEVSVTNKFVLDASRDELIREDFAHHEESIKETPQTIRINKRSRNGC